MRSIVSILSLVLFVTPAAAAQKPECESLQQAIHQRGALVIHYSSSRGTPLFDRFVDGADRCQSKLTTRVSVPTNGGGECVLLTCDQSNDLRP
jgi:hypothetical protein